MLSGVNNQNVVAWIAGVLLLGGPPGEVVSRGGYIFLLSAGISALDFLQLMVVV